MRFQALAAAGTLFLLAGACKVVEASAHNLGELHEPDGRHRYTAALESDFRYFWRTFAEQVLRRSPLRRPAPEPVKNPPRECLGELIDLTTRPTGHPATRALQVSWCAHLALSCPWKLSRERALEHLGTLAEELEVGTPLALPEGAVPAGPAVVAEAIEGLTRAVRGAHERGERSAEARRADLVAAVEATRGLVYDVESGRRVLRASAELLRVTGLQGPSAEVVLDLVAELERRLVGEALARAQADAEPWVRAAAARAAVRSGGVAALAPWMSRFEGEDALVLRELLALVRVVGLPAPPASTEERERQISALYALLYRPEGSVRVRAMQALASLPETPELGLREEEWQAWWIERTGSSRPKLEREREAAGAVRSGAALGAARGGPR